MEASSVGLGSPSSVLRPLSSPSQLTDPPDINTITVHENSALVPPPWPYEIPAQLTKKRRSSRRWRRPCSSASSSSSQPAKRTKSVHTAMELDILGDSRSISDLLGRGGVEFALCIIPVEPGEDIWLKMKAFMERGRRSVNIVSAVGNVSKATLRRSSESDGSVTYEGPFVILSLSGLFVGKHSGNMHQTIRSDLSVSLASSENRVVGGSVAGDLIAASAVQVTGVTFNPDIKVAILETCKPAPSLLSSGATAATDTMARLSPDINASTATD